MKKIKIGVDPAFRKNGFAACIKDGKTIEFVTLNSFFAFQELVNNYKEAIFIIENSNLQNVTFDSRGSKGVISRKSRNVGANQCISQLSVDYIRHTKGTVFEVSPKQKGKKLTIKEMGYMIKKYDSVINYKPNKAAQDKRDAFKLATMNLYSLKSN